MECPGETFCCRPGTTCSRDAAGTATCLNQNGGTVPANSVNASPTQGSNNNNNVNNNSNTNIIKIGGALPQVAVASGLMVTVALLSAFLV